MCSFKTEEIEIVDLLPCNYKAQDLCALMGASRSGYYKWKKHEPLERVLNRENMIALVKALHEEYKSQPRQRTFSRIEFSKSVGFS